MRQRLLGDSALLQRLIEGGVKDDELDMLLMKQLMRARPADFVLAGWALPELQAMRRSVIDHGPKVVGGLRVPEQTIELPVEVAKNDHRASLLGLLLDPILQDHCLRRQGPAV